MTIAITGATGQLGRLVIAALRQRVPASELVALVRSPAKAADLGITAREADYNRPESLLPALQGVEKLLLISGNELGQRAAQHAAVIAAAVTAGVKQIVYTSLLHADNSPLSLAPEHWQTEQAIKASGLSYTILRNGWYTENYTGSLAGALAAGSLIGSAGNGRISSAARADFAEAAAVVLTAAGHEGQTYELAGDSAYTLSEMAAELSRQSGKTVPYVNLSVPAYAEALQGFGLPADFAGAIARWDDDASRGALFHEGKTLSGLIGRPTTPMGESVRQALAAV